MYKLGDLVWCPTSNPIEEFFWSFSKDGPYEVIGGCSTDELHLDLRDRMGVTQFVPKKLVTKWPDKTDLDQFM